MTTAAVPACRACGAALRDTFVDLGLSPVSNAFIPADRARTGEMFYPLHAQVCRACWLVQLEDVERAENLFPDDYVYFSSYSTSWLEHARRYVTAVSARFGLGPHSQVVEVASNDGYLLQYFVQAGVPCLGVEPTANTARAAREKGVPTREAFFGVATARQLLAEGCQADLLLGNNVLAHVPDINDFVGGMAVLLKPEGVITLEFPHLLRLMEGNQFDTIYHEHFSYLSLIALLPVFDRAGLRVFDVETLPTHGGSLRLYACHRPASHADTGAAGALVAREEAAGLRRVETYAAFDAKVRETKRALVEFLITQTRAGRRIAAYGAAAKGNTLLNYCGIRADFIDYVVDRNPVKQGMLLPGTRIPVLAPERIAETRPDYLLILPWNIKDEIIGQMAFIREWGGKFVVPIPRPEVIA
ncbi:class I SAM-dependent methyltransferase [Azospirillum sp.]|uniref:class I SAM-dependent methyltransferase n=1 Tax=Azospirillum sp. TaxID=34012 RepID=UPI002D6636B0|nr:class I SAM-dependent methyltransferase [Azospirillum sp.]HYD69453.1 class I SAM-dependent methyltransferase [Azospirillum sp.]